MATSTINGQQMEAAEGRPLVEVIKEHGFAISNLCYLDGLPAYAGCRTAWWRLRACGARSCPAPP